MKKIFLGILAIGIVGGSFYVSRLLTTDDGTEAEAGFRRGDQPVTVSVALAGRETVRELITYPGSVAANETVSITPRVTGIIRKIEVEFGDFASEGDPLMVIDDSEYVERLKQARANLELANAQLRRRQTLYELARREFERMDRSGEQGITSQAELDSARAARDSAQAEMEVARAEVERMQAALEEAQLNVQNTHITSPLSGYVQERHADPGALATPNSPVLTLVDTDPAEVVVYVPEREMALAEVGKRASISVNDGAATFNGRVTRVAPSLRMATRTQEVVIDVPNPDGRLRPGMSADVTFVAEEVPNALVVPSKALVFQNERTEVYRITDGKAYAIPVQVGIETETLAQIDQGLAEGDLVVTEGQFMLKDEQPVKYETPSDAAWRADS